MGRPGPQGGQYQPLTEAEVAQIHHASLRVLEQTGIQVEHGGALDLYRSGGARIDGQRVTIRREMVDRALASVPGQVLLAGREPDQDVVLEGKRVYLGTGGSPTQILDPGATTLRPGTLSDLVDLARLAGRLEHCDFCVMPLYPSDVPEADVPVNRFYACLAHSPKHVMGSVGSAKGAHQVAEMASLIAGGEAELRRRPIVSAVTSWMVSPLRLDTAVTDILVEWCRLGLPVALSSAPMAGSTSPVTLAGTLVQLHAEQLSGIVLTQLARPGTPVLAGYIPGVADLRGGGYLGGAIEFGMMQAAAAQLANACGVPIYGSGGMSDSKLPDVQAGYEKMASLLLAAMGGCNYIHHAIGMVANMNAVSLEEAVIDDEIAGMVLRALRGIGVTEHSLAVEAIERVGPGGHYLMDEHTLRFMRNELYQPRLADRRNPAVWEADGRPEMRARAAARVHALLGEPARTGLESGVDAAIRARFNILV